MNKFRESVDSLFDEMTKADAEIEESLTLFDEISGRINQMSFLPGAVRANEMAAEQAEHVLKQIKEAQQQEIEGVRGGVTMKELYGLLTREEKETLKEEARQQAEQVQQAEQQRERQSNLLYES